jgi:hypothetical protein
MPPPRSPACAALWTEAEQADEKAKQAHATADPAIAAAVEAEAAYAAAQKAVQDTKDAHESVLRASSEVAAELARLEAIGPQIVDERLQQETSHAAYLSFRRGDISAEQLREVFRRAEGWTPEHDRLTQRKADLRDGEGATAKARIEAERALPAAAEKARQARVVADALEATARDADNAAQARQTAAEQCEARNRR